MEFTRDFQLVLAGGLISLATTVSVLILITLLLRLDRRGENK
jgi:hypothetical protein